MRTYGLRFQNLKSAGLYYALIMPQICVLRRLTHLYQQIYISLLLAHILDDWRDLLDTYRALTHAAIITTAFSSGLVRDHTC